MPEPDDRRSSQRDLNSDWRSGKKSMDSDKPNFTAGVNSWTPRSTTSSGGPWNPPTLSASHGDTYVKNMNQTFVSNFVEGTIFLAWQYIEVGVSDEINPELETIITVHVAGKEISKVFVKHRKYVVIARFTTHFLALPVYTHGGRGLIGKNRSRSEYVSLRDRYSKYSCKEPDSDHGTLFAVPGPGGSGSLWTSQKDHSYIWLSNPTPLRYTIRCMIVSSMEPESLARLYDLYMMITTKTIWKAHGKIDPVLWKTTPGSIGWEKNRGADIDKLNKTKEETDQVEREDELSTMDLGSSARRNSARELVNAQKEPESSASVKESAEKQGQNQPQEPKAGYIRLGRAGKHVEQQKPEPKTAWRSSGGEITKRQWEPESSSPWGYGNDPKRSKG